MGIAFVVTSLIIILQTLFSPKKKGANWNMIFVAAFFLFLFQTLFSGVMPQEILVSTPNSPINTSSGVRGSMQCTKNSDESYAVCASSSNAAVKYNLQPFSFAAKGLNYGNFMYSCDLYETSSESTSRAVSVKREPLGAKGIVYFHRVSDMVDVTSVTIGIAGNFPHVIVDTPNHVAYICNNRRDNAAIYKITSIGSSNPIVAGNVSSFGFGDNQPAAMLIIGGFLYVHFDMSPARLARIDISTFTWNQTVIFTSEEYYGSYDNLANDDHFIYDLTQNGILVRCIYKNNNFTRFDSLKTGLRATFSLAISPDFSFLLFTSFTSGIIVVSTTSFAVSLVGSKVLLPNPTSTGYVEAFGRPIILSKNNNLNTYPVCAFSRNNDFLYTFNVNVVYPTIYPLPSSPMNTSSGVSGSTQCTTNSDESYAVCASISSTAIKYNLQPFSFAAKGPNQGGSMWSCDLYETSSQSTSRAVCVKGTYPASKGIVYFHRVSDMINITNVTIGVTGTYPHVIVDTPNQVAFISSYYNPPAIYKITSIGSSTPILAGNLSSFGSGDTQPAAMLIIGGFLYAQFYMYTNPARLGRINISTFTWNKTVAFTSEENRGQYDNLANDDNFVYDLTQFGILVRCTYKNNNFARFDSLNTGLTNTYSLGISPDQKTLFVASYGYNLLQMINVTSFSTFGNTVTVPSALGRPIITTWRNVYAFSSASSSVYAFNMDVCRRIANQSTCDRDGIPCTWCEDAGACVDETESCSTIHCSSFSTVASAVDYNLCPSSQCHYCAKSKTCLNKTEDPTCSCVVASSSSSACTESGECFWCNTNISFFEQPPNSVNLCINNNNYTSAESQECNCAFLPQHICNQTSSPCKWCDDFNTCVDESESCSSIHCKYFSAVASTIDNNLCPPSQCHYCPKSKTCLNRTEDPTCSCVVASSSSSACAESGECFWCNTNISFFEQPPNSVNLCIDNNNNTSAESQQCNCAFLPQHICNQTSSPCKWCDAFNSCIDKRSKSCEDTRCTDFTPLIQSGQCPSKKCGVCQGICVGNEFVDENCNPSKFDETTCRGCHNCSWNLPIVLGVGDSNPYCVMSASPLNCESPPTCNGINSNGNDKRNQCKASGCKFDDQTNQCVNLRCFSFFLNSFVIQPLGLMIIGFIKDVIMLLLFGVFGDIVVKILKRKLFVPFKFWKNNWNKNRIKVNLDRTIFVNDSKARDFTSDKSESFEEYCVKIAEKFFELPETNDEEIRKDWKRRVVDAVTFAMFDTGLWFNLDDDGYGKLDDDEKEPTKLNGVAALMMNETNDEENENQEQEIRQEQQYTLRENEVDKDDKQKSVSIDEQVTRENEVDNEESGGDARNSNMQKIPQKIEMQPEISQQNAPELEGDAKQQPKKIVLVEDTLSSRPQLQTIVQRIITENATCVVYYASSRVTSVRAATALNSFPSPLQLFYYLLGIIFLVSTSFVSVVLNEENQSIISRIASYSCTSSNSTSSSASSDIGVSRSTFILLGFRLMNASTVATVFLVLVKTVRAIWASYGGRFNQLQLPQRLPVMGLYTKRSSRILLGFYFGVVLIFALVGFFYGFKITASLKVMGITIAIFVCDILLLISIRFLTSRVREKDFEKRKNDVKVEEEELASRLISNVNFDLNRNEEKAQESIHDFDEITAQEAIDVKKQSLSNSAPTSLPQALIVFLLTEEFPTVLLTISLQLCYNYMCLVEYKSSFGFTDENLGEISAREYDSRSMTCIWELFQDDVSGYANGLSSFVAFL